MKRITSLLLTLIIICAALCSCSSNIPGEDLTKDVSADENKTYYFKKGETIAPTSYTDSRIIKTRYTPPRLYTVSLYYCKTPLRAILRTALS